MKSRSGLMLLLCILVGWLIIGLLAFLMLMLIPDAAADTPLPVARAGTTQFETLDAAARVALEEARDLSGEYEYGGVVIQCGGSFIFTTPVTNKSTVQVNYHVQYSSACKIAAIYHTHPGNGRDAHMMSRQDSANRRRLGVPSYILVIRTGQVAVYAN